MNSQEQLARNDLPDGDESAYSPPRPASRPPGLVERWGLRRLRRTFEDKVVVITGGSRGLGLELGRVFTEAGARVAFCARTEDDVERAESDLMRAGSEVFGYVCDITQPDQLQRFIEAVTDRFGTIHVLVNNAGVIQAGPMECMTLDDYRAAMDTHYWAPLHAILAVLPHMRRQGEGRIVNISSIGGRISVPHLLPYSASKFALVGLSEGLRAELVKDGIYVTTVSPGLMRTGSPRNAGFKGQHRAEYAWFSISDSLPIVSMNSRRAARQIAAACRRRSPQVILSLPAKIAVRFHGLFPGLTVRLLGLANRFLPAPGGVGVRTKRGEESFSKWSPSRLTHLTEQAAVRNNEVR